MKRFLFPALVLCAALASACQSPTPNDNNTNRGPNQNAANINQGLGNVNASPTPGPMTRDPRNKAVLITVYADAAGKPQIAVAPNSIVLSKGKGQKLRFIVFNNLDADVKEVKITFKADDPMDGTYTFGPVLSGTDVKSNSQGIKPAATTGKKYAYTITVTIDGVGTPITLDPDVEVAT